MHERGVIKLTLLVGQKLLLGIKLQILFIAFSLLGGVVLGVFPALATCSKILLRRMTDKKDPSDALFGAKKDQFKLLGTEFWQFYRQSFWEINGICYLGLLISAVLIFDLAVNQRLIHSTTIQYGLVVLLIMLLSYWMYVLTIYARYDLHFWQYFRQALIISIAHFSDTLAIILGSVVVTTILVVFPVLTFIAIIPLYLTPMVWFSLQSCLHVEAVMTYART